jgi:sensor histidine kinase YesM/ligand-binding sensor domain-containing protein
MNKLIYIAIAVLIYTAFAPVAYAQPRDFDFPNYTTTNGLVTNVVHHGMQDSRGYMWFATDSGVSRFDGNRFRHFTTQDGLGGNEIFYIYEDSRQRLWFLSFNGVPSYFHNNSFYNPSNDTVLAQLQFGNMLVSVFEDHENAIWLMSQDATIYNISKDEHIQKIPATGLVNTIRQAWVDQHNRIHVGTANNTLHFNEIERKWEIKDHLSYRVIQQQHTREGSFLIPSRDGIVYTGSSITSAPYYIHRNILGIQAEITFAMRSMNSIYMAVGTIVDGVHFYDYEGGLTRTSVAHLLPGQTITSVTFDTQESIWITTLRNGIYRIDRSYRNIRNIASKAGLNDFSIRTSFTSRDGYQWYGTDAGRILGFDADGQFLDIAWPDNPPNNVSIEDITELGDGRIGIATASSFHLVRRLAADLITTTDIVDLPGKQLLQLGDKLIYGTISGLYAAPIDSPQSMQALLGQRVTALEQCEGKHLWVGTINGMYRFDENLQPVGLPSAFNGEQITDIEALYEGIVAVATHGSGVILYNTADNLIRRIDSYNGLADDLVKTIRFDRDKLWVSTGTGINLISLNPDSDLDFQFERLPQGIHYFSGRLFGTQIRHIELREGDIWLAGDNTLLSLDRVERGATPTVVPLHINEITVNDRIYTRDFPQEVPHYDNQWIFNFTGILFRDADRQLYRYRLRQSNTSAEWSVTSNAEVTYRSIPPGSYIFEVESFTSDGNASSAMTSYRFSILRPWWMLPWVWVLIALGSVGAVALLFNYQIRQVQKQEEQKHSYQRQINELEYQALQAMMSPHFVFNILSNIRYQILKDDKVKASKLLVDFSKLIRKQLDSAYQRSTSLNEELDRLQLYVDIESIRLPHPIKFIRYVAPDVDPITTRIPSMLLQPFVENAIIHGIIPKNSPGEITIKVGRSTQGQLLIVISDNGTGLKVHQRSTVEGDRLSLGVTLIEQRLAILAKDSGLKWDVTIENITDESGYVEGVRISVLLPIK